MLKGLLRLREPPGVKEVVVLGRYELGRYLIAVGHEKPPLARLLRLVEVLLDPQHVAIADGVVDNVRVGQAADVGFGVRHLELPDGLVDGKIGTRHARHRLRYLQVDAVDVHAVFLDVLQHHPLHLRTVCGEVGLGGVSRRRAPACGEKRAGDSADDSREQGDNELPHLMFLSISASSSFTT